MNTIEQEVGIGLAYFHARDGFARKRHIEQAFPCRMRRSITNRTSRAKSPNCRVAAIAASVVEFLCWVEPEAG